MKRGADELTRPGAAARPRRSETRDLENLRASIALQASVRSLVPRWMEWRDSLDSGLDCIGAAISCIEALQVLVKFSGCDPSYGPVYPLWVFFTRVSEVGLRSAEFILDHLNVTNRCDRFPGPFRSSMSWGEARAAVSDEELQHLRNLETVCEELRDAVPGEGDGHEVLSEMVEIVSFALEQLVV